MSEEKTTKIDLNDWIQTEKIYNHKRVRQVYYFSIEFLLGRLLNTNLLNCDMEELCRSALQDFGFDLEDIFPEEPDPGLGNGGLGRLAACYIDSMATLNSIFIISFIFISIWKFH